MRFVVRLAVPSSSQRAGYFFGAPPFSVFHNHDAPAAGERDGRDVSRRDGRAESRGPVRVGEETKGPRVRGEGEEQGPSSASGGLTSTLLDRWWHEARAPARRLPGRPHEAPPTAMRGDQAVAFFNRTGLPPPVRPSRASPPTARPAHARHLDPSSSPLPRPEVLVTVWELAKLDRRGAPTGLLRLEFEAACCLVSLALFENLAALDRRALDARDASEAARGRPAPTQRLAVRHKRHVLEVSTFA